MKREIVIITDLDGSLLHSRTYSFSEAIPALNLIKERNIPLIFSSSKTRTEIELYRNKLDNNHPFVSENGGGIFIPEDYFPFNIKGDKKELYLVISFGTPYIKVRKVFNNIKKQLLTKIKGFGDMTLDEVSKITGMTNKEAFFAKQRDFDEPFFFDRPEKDKNKFLRAIERRGFSWTEGRLFHVLGNHDKGKAASLLFGFYRKLFRNITTVGIGDGYNDFPLLKKVDYPVLIPNEDGSYAKGIQLSSLMKAEVAGPKGWNKAVIEILEKI